MAGRVRTAPEEHPDLRWYDNGQSCLSGSLLKLFRRLDSLFLRWAAHWNAREYTFPTFLPARELARVDYLRSFPQHATFPVVLSPEDENLESFIDGSPINEEGIVQTTRTAPVRDILTPAACYHFYVHFQGNVLEAPRYVTTRATCFRRETEYSPLQRQWSFEMREIVCLGTEEEVSAFLESSREQVKSFLETINLPVSWETASDPFFNPTKNPKFLMQKIEPVKIEMMFDGRLAIGSTNFHRTYFGETFSIKRAGQEAFSGCVAFGLERWIYSILSIFGPNEADWPQLEDL